MYLTLLGQDKIYFELNQSSFLRYKKIMKTKNKIFIIITILTSLLCGCQSQLSSPESTSIEGVYMFNRGTLDNSNSPSAIVAKLSSANLIGCPKDFIDAYNQYIAAWRGFADIEKKMYAENLKKADRDLDEFIKNYQSSPTASVVKLKQQWQNLSNEIDNAASNLSNSFVNLKNVGAKYNVVYNTPSSWL